MSSVLASKITFVGAKNHLSIRFKNAGFDRICEAATTLKARYIVMREDEGWTVYDFSRADKNNPRAVMVAISLATAV